MSIIEVECDREVYLMKKYIFAILMCICSVTFLLAGCGSKGLEGGPASSDPVIGNGGFAVIKGDYLYYANAYSSQTNVAYNSNGYGDETLSALYRTKLSETGDIQVDEDGNPKGAELLAKQIIGFEQSSIYIFGDYIYYATPATLKDDTGALVTGLLTFHRIKLDGTSHKQVGSIKTVVTDFAFAQIGDNVVISTLSDNTVKTIIVNKKGGTSSKTIASNVTSAVLPRGVVSEGTVDATIFFSQAVTLKDDGVIDGNKVCKASPFGGDAIDVFKDGKTYTLNGISNGRLYFTENSIMRSTDLNGGINQYAYNALESYKALPTTSGDSGIVATITSGDYNRIVYCEATQTGSSSVKVLVDGVASSKKLTILYVTSTNVVYSDGTAVMSKAIFNNNAPTTLSDTLVTTIGEKTIVDFDDDNIFFFNTVEDSNGLYKYLHMFKVDIQEAQTQLVGSLDSTDVKAEEDAE